MKIGIITFHFPYNCGAVLQCAALQTFIEKLGHQASVINYRPWYHQNRYTPFKNPLQFARTMYETTDADASWLKHVARWCEGFFRAVGSWRHYGRRKVQDRKFRGFIRSYLHETRVYRTIGALRRRPPKCGLYISGSDQLWNAHITNKAFDEAYFLKFGAKNIGRISYAVGADFSVHPSPESVLPALLCDFDAIALREMKCYDDVRKYAPDKPIANTVDPTFLLSREDYDQFMCTRTLETEPFIFTYTMPNESQHKVYNAAKLLSERLGLKVVDASGNPTKVNAKIEDHRVCGPDEFLWYMKHADYVLTNSFHGTAFSIIMEKQFCTIPHTQTGNRVTEILNKVGLDRRWVKSGFEAVERIMEPIDFVQMREKLETFRRSSADYIKDCIRLYGDASIN